MQKTIYFINNPFSTEQADIELVYTDDVLKSIYDHHPCWNNRIEIYHETISEATKVTPFLLPGADEHNKNEIDKLASLEGKFYVVQMPGDPVTAIIIVAVVIVAAVAFLLVSASVPTPSLRNSSQTSGNNELSGRTNKERLNARIPDIYGTVRSTPDLIAVPYTKFIDNIEYEHSLMCIGRGSYAVSDVKDGDSLVSSIEGSSVEVYGPNTSPNSGSPELTIGDPITDGILNVKRINEINGQILIAPNKGVYQASGNVRAVHARQTIYDPNPEAAGKYRFRNNGSFDWSDYFEAGQEIVVTGATYTESIGAINLSGTYIVGGAYSIDMWLQSPQLVNSAWDNIDDDGIDETTFGSPKLATIETKVVGPFLLNSSTLDKVFVNIVATNGIYKQGNNNQLAETVNFRIQLTPTNSTGTTTGATETFNFSIKGSALSAKLIGKTVEVNPTFTGFCKISLTRTSDTDRTFEGNVVDEIAVRDIFIVSVVSQSNFGDVTLVHSKTKATSGALALKSRKLNMLVTRKLKLRISGNSFGSTRVATNNAAEIIANIALDPQIGNRKVKELDLDNIYSTITSVNAYFGNIIAGQFNYTFDKDNISFEETIAVIAETVFCLAYRQGSQIKLKFEKQNLNSVLLFNHRNKIPGTETKTIRFGNSNEYDGVELEYVSDKDDAIETFSIPKNGLVVNPLKIETIGVRSYAHAYWHAFRAWNKIKYQNVAVEVEVTSEAAVLTRSDRILIADNTQPYTQDGEILAVTGGGYTLKTSQPVVAEEGEEYVIYLQMDDGTIDIIPITITNEHTVQLVRLPNNSLVVDSDSYCKTAYMVVSKGDKSSSEYLVSEKSSSSDNYSFNLKAINYDERYYWNDEIRLLIDLEEGVLKNNSAFPFGLSAEGTGVVVSDSSFRYAFSAINENDYIKISGGFLASNFYTKAFWVKKATVGEEGSLFSTIYATDPNLERLYLTGTSIRMMHDGEYITAPFPETTNWIHVAVTYVGTTAKIYINGELLESGTLPGRALLGLSVNAIALNVGSYSGIVGKYAQIYYFKRALSDKEIYKLYKLKI